MLNITFFIPRSLWRNKSWPYATYFTAALLNIKSAYYLGWHMTTSWFGEAIANLGWIGFPFGIWSFVMLGRISEKKQNIIATLISITTLSLLMVLHFSAIIWLIIAWIFSLLFLKRKTNK